MSDICDDCGRDYFIIYRVPNHIWTKICPKPETLGDYIEHQFGGILCPDCAARKARDIGVTLYFNAENGWDNDRDEIIRLRNELASTIEALKKRVDAKDRLIGYLNENYDGEIPASFLERLADIPDKPKPEEK